MFITTKEQQEYLKAILNDVYFPINFGTYKDTDELDCDCDILLSLNDDDFYSLHGASKYILINDKLPFVIKVPFNGYWEEDYCEETDEYLNDYSFVDFDGACASLTNNYSNYCSVEEGIYEIMNDRGFGVFFAETKFFTEVNFTPVYIQEKVIPFSDSKSKSFRQIKTSKLAEKLANEGTVHLPDTWIEAAICHYGKELTKEFIDFLKSNDDIAILIGEDLHSDNFGYRENGEPCILDYSGYNC